MPDQGIVQRERDLFGYAPGSRNIYDGAFDGSTVVGAQKGNRPTPDAVDGTPEAVPFTNLRGGNR